MSDSSTPKATYTFDGIKWWFYFIPIMILIVLSATGIIPVWSIVVGVLAPLIIGIVFFLSILYFRVLCLALTVPDHEHEGGND